MKQPKSLLSGLMAITLSAVSLAACGADISIDDEIVDSDSAAVKRGAHEYLTFVEPVANQSYAFSQPIKLNGTCNGHRIPMRTLWSIIGPNNHAVAQWYASEADTYWEPTRLGKLVVRLSCVYDDREIVWSDREVTVERRIMDRGSAIRSDYVNASYTPFVDANGEPSSSYRAAIVAPRAGEMLRVGKAISITAECGDMYENGEPRLFGPNHSSFDGSHFTVTDGTRVVRHDPPAKARTYRSRWGYGCITHWTFRFRKPGMQTIAFWCEQGSLKGSHTISVNVLPEEGAGSAAAAVTVSESAVPASPSAGEAAGATTTLESPTAMRPRASAAAASSEDEILAPSAGNTEGEEQTDTSDERRPLLGLRIRTNAAPR